MAVIHPDNPDNTFGSRTNGAELSSDLLQTQNIISSYRDETADDDATTSIKASGTNTEEYIFDSYLPLNEIWTRIHLDDNSQYASWTGKISIYYTDDGGSTWTQIDSQSSNNWGDRWFRWQFNSVTVNGIRVDYTADFDNANMRLYETEAHRALIPDNISSTLNAEEYRDDDVLSTSATIVDKNGNPVPNIDADITIIDESGNQIVSQTKTSDSNGQVTFSDITDIDTSYTADTAYELKWDATGYKTFQAFYILPDVQEGNESVVRVYSQNGNPVRNAEVYVDNQFMGYTNASGELGIRYLDFPTKASGSYEFVVIKGNRGAAKTVANGNEEYVQFGRANSEEPDSLNTSESRYSNVY